MTQFSIVLFSILLINMLISKDLFASQEKVDVFYPEISQQHELLILTGTVEAKQNADLAPLQSGVVAQFFVEQGDIIVKGQKLLLLDAKLAELSLAQSKAKVTAATAEKDEAERLYKEMSSLSKKQLVAETLMAERLSGMEIAKAELAQAKAELAHQKELVARHTLFAPFAGVIAQRNIDLGEWVTQQTRAFTLVEQGQLRLAVDIPQEYYQRLVGHAIIDVDVIQDFNDGEVIKLKLDRLVAVASNSSRTVTGLIGLPAEVNLVAGMSARAEINLPASEQATLLLPKSAIKQHPDGGQSVFTVVNGQAKRILIEVVKQQGDKVTVKGAPANQPFIISGVELLKDGDALSVNQLNGHAL